MRRTQTDFKARHQLVTCVGLVVTECSSARQGQDAFGATLPYTTPLDAT
jgi:hypothetical protein